MAGLLSEDPSKFSVWDAECTAQAVFYARPSSKELALVSSLARKLSWFLSFIPPPKVDFVRGKNDNSYKYLGLIALAQG